MLPMYIVNIIIMFICLRLQLIYYFFYLRTYADIAREKAQYENIFGALQTESTPPKEK